MKPNSIILALSVLTLCFDVQVSKSSNSEIEQKKIQKIILENISDHNFPSIRKNYESGTIGPQNFKVDLQDKNLGNEGIKIVVEKIMLDPYREEIQVLNVKNNNIEVSGAISLSYGLEYLKGLKELDITHNSINLIGLQTIFIKASSLKNLEKIRYTGKVQEQEELEKLFKGQIKSIDDKNIDFIAFFEEKLES